MKRIVIAAACGALVVLLPFARAAACSCAVRAPKELLASADVAFSGRVVAVQVRARSSVVSFAIERVYKGSVGHAAPVTGEATSDCTVPFVEGRRYTVFAHLRSGTLVTSLCDGTADGAVLDSAGVKPIRIESATPAVSPPAPKQLAAAQPAAPGRHGRGAPATVAVVLAVAAAAGLVRFRRGWRGWRG